MTKADRERFKAIQEEALVLGIYVSNEEFLRYNLDEKKWVVFSDFAFRCTEGIAPDAFTGSGPNLKCACFNALAEWCKQRQKERKGR